MKAITLDDLNQQIIENVRLLDNGTLLINLIDDDENKDEYYIVNLVTDLDTIERLRQSIGARILKADAIFLDGSLNLLLRYTIVTECGTIILKPKA